MEDMKKEFEEFLKKSKKFKEIGKCEFVIKKSPNNTVVIDAIASSKFSVAE